jgi:hypothetical protein
MEMQFKTGLNLSVGLAGRVRTLESLTFSPDPDPKGFIMYASQSPARCLGSYPCPGTR